MRFDLAMTDPIWRRVERRVGIPDLVHTLAEELSASDLSSLLLEVARRHAERTPPARLLARQLEDAFVRPSSTSPVDLARFDLTAFGLLPEGFLPIELAPVAPLGTSTVVAPIDQGRILSTHRSLEVLSDSTNVLALECAHRRRQQLARGERHALVRLAASHRLLRVPSVAAAHSTQHFRIFSLYSAGRDRGGFAFESSALVEHIDFYLKLFSRVGELGYRVRDPEIDLTDLSHGSARDALKEHVIARLAREHPSVPVHLSSTRTRGRGYYRLANFQLRARTPHDEVIELCDGGPVDWTAQLLSNRKERGVISGLGSERLLTAFRTSPEQPANR